MKTSRHHVNRQVFNKSDFMIPLRWVHEILVQSRSIVCCFSALLPAFAATLETLPLEPLKRGSNAETLFETLSEEQSGVSFQMTLPGVSERFRELLQLAALGGITTGDYDNDGLCDFFVSSPLGGSQLYRNLGGFRFEQMTQAVGMDFSGFWATGSNFIDIDSDGLLDLYVCGYRMPNRLFVNRGPDKEGRFTFQEQAGQLGLAFNGGSMQMYFSDMDLDGDLDAYLATTAIPPPPGVKFEVRFEGKKPVVPEALREYWGLIYLPGEKAHPSENGQYDHLYRNDEGIFREVTREAGIDGPYLTLGAIWWDCNQDGWPDLYVANDYLGPDMLYLNQQDGTFKEVIRDRIPHTPWSSMGVDIGDLNNDGKMDLIACDMMGSSHYRRQVMLGEGSRKAWFLDFAQPRQYSRNAVYLNTGSDRFMEIAYLSGLAATDWTWAPRIEDFDLDGKVDVFFTNGMLRDVQHSDLANYADRTFKGGSPEWANFWSTQPIRKEQNKAFRNLGDLRFEEVSASWGLNHSGVSFGAATADFDNDGDLDMVVNDADGPIEMLRNQSLQGQRLLIQLKGKDSHAQGIGATVSIEAGGVRQTRYCLAGRGWLSGSEPLLHFGLGDATFVDEIQIDWPCGSTQKLQNIQANQRLIIHEPNRKKETRPTTPARIDVNTWFKATEISQGGASREPFDDFALQPLLPRKQSQGQMASTWGDINGDSIMDGYVGGGWGLSGTLYFGEGKGAFRKIEASHLDQPGQTFETDAMLVDWDQDHDLDLIISHSSVLPRAKGQGISILINDGQGNLEHRPEISPKLAPSIQCLAVTPVSSQPGNYHVFLGGGALPGQYPVGSPSYLLEYREGQWKDLTPSAMKKPWLVQDACWADLNGDGKVELLIAVEWGSMKVFHQTQEGWKPLKDSSGLDSLSGWWNHVSAIDVDGDGDLDIVGGNRGENSAYRPTMEEPDWLLYGDLNQDGRSEIVETYGENGIQYPRRGFEALSRSVPTLRQQFLNFHQFASSSLAGMFSREALAKAFMLRVTTATSGVWINQGNYQFNYQPLPVLAQASPIMDVAAADLNRDGHIDLILAQNDYSIQPMHGRMDGGLGLILLGGDSLQFKVASPELTGLIMEGDTRFVEVMDLNGDQKKDLLMGGPNRPIKAFLRQ